LKEPLPSSTNYLGAYDRSGNLVRARPGFRRTPKGAAEKDQVAETEDGEEKKDAEPTPGGQQSMDELELSTRRDEEKAAKQKSNDAQKLPPETAEDLRPFPLNKYFRSQPVLSEELREAIYQRVTRDGATVSLASVEYGVSNERVAAVVRLKQMEKEWVAQVRILLTPLIFPLHDETIYKID
jgi:hypothetical protein